MQARWRSIAVFILMAFGAWAAEAQPTASERAKHEQKNAFNELKKAFKNLAANMRHEVNPEDLGHVVIMPLNEPQVGVTLAGGYLRGKLEKAMRRAGFKRVAGVDPEAEDIRIKKICWAARYASDATTTSIGDAYGARTVIFGRIDQVGDTLEVTIRAIDKASGTSPFIDDVTFPVAAIPEGYLGKKPIGWPIKPSRGGCGVAAAPPPASGGLRVAVMPWGGYAGGWWLKTQLESSQRPKFLRDMNLVFDLIPVKSIPESVDLWKRKEVDVMWITVDDFPTEYPLLAEAEEPRIIMQTAWSRGEMTLLARNHIGMLNDLDRSSVLLVPRSPAHSFLLISLDLAGLPPSGAKILSADRHHRAAQRFMDGEGDAAVVWIPDDERVKRRLGSGVTTLETTKDADFLIAEVLVARASVVERDRERLQALVNSWLWANARLAESPRAREQVVRFMQRDDSKLNVDLRTARRELSSVRLATVGDNINFFGLNEKYVGERGDRLYEYFWKNYRLAGVAKTEPPSWSRLTDTSFVRQASKILTGPAHRAEDPPTYGARCKKKSLKILSDRRVDVKFGTGRFTLTEDDRNTIDDKFAHLARIYQHDCIKIEGNTDDVGSKAENLRLSKRRAAAVRNYLVDAHKFPRDRIVVQGNGERKFPILLDREASGLAQKFYGKGEKALTPLQRQRLRALRAQARRTDFELLRDPAE